MANSWAGTFGFSYDALYRRTQMTRPNSITTNYSYDTLSRLLSVLHQASGSTIDGATYTVDYAGNRTSKADALAGVTSNYTYDAIYELTQTAQGGNATETYTYDPVGNRQSSLGVSPYSYNVSNELTSTPSTSYSFDANGNTTMKTNSSGATGYTWDFDNRLASVTLPGSSGEATFKYDPFGRRIQKAFTQNSTTTTTIYVYDGHNTVEETDQNGNLLAKYARTARIDEPLAESRSGTASYYEADGLGSISSLTSSAGAVANSYTYDSFGNVTNSSGSLTNPLRYTARDFDTETNLYFYRARYYDPSAGRFLNEDPLQLASDDLNLYRYVSNSPVNFTDPEGLYRWYDCGGGCGFRFERDMKGPHVNWECNGLKGCLKIPSLEICEAGKSDVPPQRIRDCVKKHMKIPEVKQSPPVCLPPIQLPNLTPLVAPILLWILWLILPKPA